MTIDAFDGIVASTFPTATRTFDRWDGIGLSKPERILWTSNAWERIDDRGNRLLQKSSIVPDIHPKFYDWPFAVQISEEDEKKISNLSTCCIIDLRQTKKKKIVRSKLFFFKEKKRWFLAINVIMFWMYVLFVCRIIIEKNKLQTQDKWKRLMCSDRLGKKWN